MDIYEEELWQYEKDLKAWDAAYPQDAANPGDQPPSADQPV
jgi:hypothetical protein